MKKTVLLLALTFACIATAYSQIDRTYQPVMPQDSLSKMSYKTDQFFGFENGVKPDHLHKYKIIEPLLTDGSKWNNSTPSQPPAPDNMPCHKPLGLFPMKIIKPDTTTLFTMLIK